MDLNRPTSFYLLNDRNKDLFENTLVRHWPATTKDASVVMFNRLITFNHNSSDGGGKMLNNNTDINTGRLNVMYRVERLNRSYILEQQRKHQRYKLHRNVCI